MCKNEILATARTPCGGSVKYCVNCTQYMDQMSCAYRCGMSGGCRCAVEDCLNCLNYVED